LIQTLLGSRDVEAWRGEVFASGVVMAEDGKVETTWAFVGVGVPELEESRERVDSSEGRVKHL
jgi:hypothetical protein